MLKNRWEKEIVRQPDSIITVKHPSEIIALFNKSSNTISEVVGHALNQAQLAIDQICSYEVGDRTFDNTVQALDTIAERTEVAVLYRVMTILEMVSPDNEIRQAAHEAVKTLNNFFIESISGNKRLYKALSEYAESHATEGLSEEQSYFLTQTMKEFERNGLNLPTEKRERVQIIKKELAHLEQIFEKNIAEDNRFITVCLEELEGLEKEFIDALPKVDGNCYKLGVDYPTYFHVIENCSVEETRKRLYYAFANRAYPKNDEVLCSVIKLRDELAHLLGYESFAAYDLDNQMIKTCDRAECFLDDLIKKAQRKEEQEFKQLTAELPHSVSLTNDKKIKPWDSGFIKASYKKRHYNIDERDIACYFPMEKTIEGLFAIYESFFNLKFDRLNAAGFWHEDVEFIAVYNKNNSALLGYLLLDLYPRPNKFSHACAIDIIPSVIDEQGNSPAGVCLVIANFPKSTESKPSLLKRSDVSTFFHEFGHALHALLGRTKIAGFSGTNVKLDFVEMPSQMLEEWLWDKEVLKRLSSHYETGAQLSDEVIEKLISLRHLNTGLWVLHQAVYSKLSLAYYKSGEKKDINAITDKLSAAILAHLYAAPDTHKHASFGHLMGYGARYYGYLWSKVYALDLFTEIKKYGLFDPTIGSRYAKIVLGRGGSKEPEKLLEEFLGRKPNTKAFFSSLGIES